LKIADPVGEASHEIRYWYQGRFLPPISSVSELYDWLAQQLRVRDPDGVLSRGMPDSGESMAVEVSRKGDSAYIQFATEDNLAEDLERMPTIVKIEYVDGYAVFGMPTTYAIRISIQEFHTLTSGWRLLPTPCRRHDFRGWAIHETLTAWTPKEDFSGNDQILFQLSPIANEPLESYLDPLNPQ
jgi:hypothetical protein